MYTSTWRWGTNKIIPTETSDEIVEAIVGLVKINFKNELAFSKD